MSPFRTHLEPTFRPLTRHFGWCCAVKREDNVTGMVLMVVEISDEVSLGLKCWGFSIWKIRLISSLIEPPQFPTHAHAAMPAPPIRRRGAGQYAHTPRICILVAFVFITIVISRSRSCFTPAFVWGGKLLI